MNVHSNAKLTPRSRAEIVRSVIEHKDWRDILAIHDRPGTFFFIDPPYTACQPLQALYKVQAASLQSPCKGPAKALQRPCTGPPEHLKKA